MFRVWVGLFVSFVLVVGGLVSVWWGGVLCVGWVCRGWMWWCTLCGVVLRHMVGVGLFEWAVGGCFVSCWVLGVYLLFIHWCMLVV